MTDKETKLDCLYCLDEFDALLGWDGTPETEYCSAQCKLDALAEEEYGEETFEKFTKGGKEEWH